MARRGGAAARYARRLIGARGYRGRTGSLLGAARPGSKTAPLRERALDRYQYLYDSPAQFDMCGRCGGVWVEDGELRKMHEWLNGTGLIVGVSSRKWTAEQERRLALAIAVHEREMGRLRLLLGLFTAIGRMRR